MKTGGNAYNRCSQREGKDLGVLFFFSGAISFSHTEEMSHRYLNLSSIYCDNTVFFCLCSFHLSVCGIREKKVSFLRFLMVADTVPQHINLEQRKHANVTLSRSISNQ